MDADIVSNLKFCNRLYTFLNVICRRFGTKNALKRWCKTSCRNCLILSVFIFSPGCTQPAIYGDALFNPPVFWGSHRVKAGDTLHSIAWRYGRDYEELADINKIKSPYRIYPGQKISLVVPNGYVKKSHQLAESSKKVKKKPAAKASTKIQPRSGYKKIQKSTRKADRQSLPARVKWSWPHPGPIIDTFSATGVINKGIDIAGGRGDTVRAAAGGEVVYAGNGLLGYGNLIILNHNEVFLSAYAHNSKIIVKEGERITSGQKIAELGETGAKVTKLHFEIRKQGKPVDPLIYLPRK